jgi:hypothetical protein
MTAPLTVPKAPKTAASGMNTNFSEHLNFGVVFHGLDQNGISLSEAEKERFKRITLKELNNNNSNGFSALAPDNILQLLFAFLGVFFGGNTGTTNIADHLSASNDKAVGMAQLRHLQTAAGSISRRLKEEGGNLAAVAELATGATQSAGQPKDMDGSIYRQLHGLTGLAWGTSSTIASLDRSAQHGLPNQASTQALTERG